MEILAKLCCFFLAITFAHMEETNEPRCSKYDFEEKLLEKVVRFEVKLEMMQTKFDLLTDQLLTQQESITQDRDRLLEDARTLQDGVEAKQAAADDRVDDLVKATQAQVARMSGDVHDMLNKTLTDITDAAHVPPIAFMAQTLTDTSPNSGEILVFSDVDVNLGGGYNPDNGWFTAPETGVYMFTLQLCLGASSYIYINIVTGTGEVLNAATLSRGSPHSGCVTSSAIASLTTGDTVMVKCSAGRSSHDLYQDINHDNTFSGVFIRNRFGCICP